MIMETGGKTKITELYVAIFVTCEVCYLLATMTLKLTSHQDIIWLNVTIAAFTSIILLTYPYMNWLTDG